MGHAWYLVGWLTESNASHKVRKYKQPKLYVNRKLRRFGQDPSKQGFRIQGLRPSGVGVAWHVRIPEFQVLYGLE